MHENVQKNAVILLFGKASGIWFCFFIFLCFSKVGSILPCLLGGFIHHYSPQQIKEKVCTENAHSFKKKKFFFSFFIFLTFIICGCGYNYMDADMHEVYMRNIATKLYICIVGNYYTECSLVNLALSSNYLSNENYVVQMEFLVGIPSIIQLHYNSAVLLLPSMWTLMMMFILFYESINRKKNF